MSAIKAFLVGGCVRDRLLGLPVRDRDWVVVGATAEDMAARGFQPVGKDFTAFLHPETREEYALARSGSLEADLAARDLSINAMALDDDGTLIDPFGGRADLEARVLRHVPGFADDPIRILRAARFTARLDGFAIAAETDRLPRHHGHEEAGATLVEPLVRRLAGPMAWAELGELTARWHGQVHKAAELRPGTLLKLLKAADAFHRPERLDALLTACQADYRGRTGKEDAPYPQADLVRRARDAAAAVTARALIASGHVPGPNLGDVLFQRRAEAIRDALIAR